ncbi:HTTM domain-containing protein [Flavobacterium sp. RHBU_24]|uniref:HTTM domain-containing protein n=1 Tax=Flavobacterium sp. RHBU_24 TaxID=3391185 RepID=UPI0039847739
MKRYLYRQIDNAPLVVFRIFFGFLLACETIGAIITGWVRDNFIEPSFTFSHIGMDWLQPLPGMGMYIWFVVMGILGLMVMAGYKYRFSIIAFTVLWAGVYFMQKTSYNNHYYLLLLIALIMCFLPANRFASVDVKLNPAIKRYNMPAWCSLIMIAQVSIVYLFASVAKFYPGWLNGTFVYGLLDQSVTINGFRNVIVTRPFALFIAYAGIAFDLLVVPLMLFKRTRTLAFIASIIFHIFNSITLQIGIFPFFALSFAVFLYPPETIRSLFLQRKPRVIIAPSATFEGQTLMRYFFIPYLIVQLALPLRHYFIKGDVLWTEEGHRLSWRMMLRTRNGHTQFNIIDKKTGNPVYYSPDREMTAKQQNVMVTRPDMIWQTAQRIKKYFATQGKDVAVYADSHISINHGPYRTLINPETDLATAKWDYFFHNEWILLYDTNNNPVK